MQWYCSFPIIMSEYAPESSFIQTILYLCRMVVFSIVQLLNVYTYIAKNNIIAIIATSQ